MIYTNRSIQDKTDTAKPHRIFDYPRLFAALRKLGFVVSKSGRSMWYKHTAQNSDGDKQYQVIIVQYEAGGWKFEISQKFAGECRTQHLDFFELFEHESLIHAVNRHIQLFADRTAQKSSIVEVMESSPAGIDLVAFEQVRNELTEPVLGYQDYVSRINHIFGNYYITMEAV